MKSTTSLRIVAVSHYAGMHKTLLDSVHAQIPLALLIQPTLGPGKKKKLAQRISRLSTHPLRTLRNLVNNRYLSMQMRRLSDRIAELLPAPHKVANFPILRTRPEQLDAAKTLAEIESIDPQVLLVSGAPILCKRFLNTSHGLNVNVHYGIAPVYRGEHTIYFAMLNGDWENVGITLHLISADIDGGDVLARGFPALHANDDEASILVKCNTMAKSMVLRVLTRLQSGDRLGRGEIQSLSESKLFRYRDRSCLTDLKQLVRRRLLGCCPPEREEKIVWYV